MPETILDLGRKVKAKYPGQYDDLSDAEVGQKVKAKYPNDYSDFTDVAAAPARPSGKYVLDNAPDAATPLGMAGQQIKNVVGGAGEAAGYDANHPVVGTAINVLDSLRRASNASNLGNVLQNPREAIETYKGMAQMPVNLAKDFFTAGRTAIQGAGELISPGTHRDTNILAAAPEAARASGRALVTAPVVAGMVEAAGGIPGAAKAVRNAPSAAVNATHDFFKPKSEISYLRATGSNDPNLPETIPSVLDEFKAWEKQTGKTVDKVPIARQAIDERITDYNKLSDQIAGPQRDVVVPGSRIGLATAKINAIPDEVRLNQPRQYANRVKAIHDAAQGPEYTIGDLDDLRKDLQTKNKAYGKNLSGQIAAEHSNQAIDAAAEKYARAKFYDSLFENSGDEQVRVIKKQIGALIENDNALRPIQNKSMVESGKPFTERMVETGGKILTPGSSLKHFGTGATIDSDLASAVRQWKRTPASIVTGPPKLPNPITRVPPPLALPPATNPFQIDKSAGPLYGQPTAADQLRGMIRKPAQPGEGIPMRDVTPPKRLMLNAKPTPIQRIVRSSGKTYNMPAPIAGLLEQFLERQKSLGPKPPKQLTAATALRNRVFPMAESSLEVPGELIDEIARSHMDMFADIHESGVGEVTGKLKRQASPNPLATPNAGFELLQRMGGGQKEGTPLSHFKETPAQLANAIRRGKGPLFEDILKAYRDHAKDYAKDVTDQFSKETAGWD